MVDRTNAERQRRYIARLKAKAAGVSNGSGDPNAHTVTNGAGVTVTVSENWREPLANSAEYLGVPAGEYADLLMQLGQMAFNRKFQSGLSNEIAWWLIEMHSKYPDTFEVGSWEGSCGELALDKLYEQRGIRVGKYQEWKAEQDAKKAEIANRKAAWAAKMEASGALEKMAYDRELKYERQQLKELETGVFSFHSKEHQNEAIDDSRKRIQQLENAAKKAADAMATKKSSVTNGRK